MTRRRKPQRKAPRKPRPQPPAAAPAGEPDALADPRIRSLLARYCALAEVKQAALGPDHAELALPPAERAFFRDRETLRVAFSLDALERDPDAEIVVLGSPLLAQLLEAIRARAAHLSLGLIAPADAGDPENPQLAIPVRDGTARPGKTRLAAHPVGRLLARVVLRAGAGVEEAVVESDVHDLSTGARVDDDLAALFQDLEAGRVEPADPSLAAAAQPVPAREPADLVRILVSHLREKSAERVAARRAAVERELAAELGRLDRYFASILAEQSDQAAIDTVTALAERRRTEEVRRSQVRAIVHPLQLVEAVALMQSTEWRLESARGRRATFTTQLPLSGASAGSMACPHCGRPPATLVVCRHEHGACDGCASRCSVCAEDFCTDHGIAACRVDGQPACDEHVRVCQSCRLQHCTAHAGVCAEDGLTACSACLEPCGSCGRTVCNRHAEQSGAEAPKGSRRLCSQCARHCEGGANELVGVDEVAQCQTCGKSVCTAHQAVCVVDGQVHCSTHMRRTDTSRRQVCARHRAACAEEAGALFASDEVQACGSCGKSVCAGHSSECVADGVRHCVPHVAQCPVCGKHACAAHRAACAHCGRQVCTADFPGPERRCATCAQLVTIADPPVDVVAAARAVAGAGSRSSRAWRMGKDHSHVVVELDLGLKRQAVFTLRHGETVPDGVVRHSLLGSRRRK